MKKYLLFLTGCLLFVISTNLLANPQYYNYNNGTLQNSFPFNIATGKMIQLLIAPGEFNQPSPAPNGNITSFSVWIGSALYPLTATTYTTFRILFLDTNLTALPTSLVNGNWDTVYFRASVQFTAPSMTWLDIPLDHPHPYNNTRSLVVQIEQCAAVGATTGVFSLTHTTTAVNRRTYSTAGCPFTYGGTSLYVPNCGINVAPASTGPDYLYYKFENNPAPLLTPNCAIPGVGTTPGAITGLTLTPAGHFDTCITGIGTASAGVTTGWNCNLGTSSWTISMWLTIPSTASGTAYYLFGDPGSGTFRCFHNGIALQDNLVLRGGFTDVTVTGIGPAPTVVTFVYDSAAAQVRAYKNGVLANTVAQTLNIVTGTGFRVGGYSTSPSFVGKMDEFRLWRRALSPGEVAAMWNSDLGGCGIVAINNNNNQVPNAYKLSQNYPNPFNPITDINFAIPKSGNVKLYIYDILGREVAVLVNEFKTAGAYSVNFDASNLASGIYLYKIESGDFIDTKKMMLVK